MTEDEQTRPQRKRPAPFGPLRTVLLTTALFVAACADTGEPLEPEVTVQAASAVRWLNMVGVSVDNASNTLSKTGSVDAFDAGASSVEVIAGGDGYVEFGVTGDVMIGLNSGDSGVNEIMNFGLRFVSGTVEVLEDGQSGGVPQGFAQGALFRIEIEFDRVLYKVQDVNAPGSTPVFAVFHTNRAPGLDDKYPLLVDTALRTPLALGGSQLTNVRIQTQGGVIQCESPWDRYGNDIVSNNAGNVGIGTNVSVGHKLTVDGTIGGPNFNATYVDATGATLKLQSNEDVSVGSSLSPRALQVKQDGKVAIGGNQTPRQNLEVYALSNPAINIHDDSTGELTIGVAETANRAVFNTNTTGFEFRTGQDGTTFPGSAATRMVIANTGNVGIGVPSPTMALDVTGGIRSDRYHISGPIMPGHIYATNDMWLTTAATKDIYLSAGAGGDVITWANVGIGESNPASPLHLRGSNELMRWTAGPAGSENTTRIHDDGNLHFVRNGSGSLNFDNWGSVSINSLAIYPSNVDFKGSGSFNIYNGRSLRLFTGDGQGPTGILDAGGGRLGLGTTAPQARLEVAPQPGVPALRISGPTPTTFAEFDVVGGGNLAIRTNESGPGYGAITMTARNNMLLDAATNYGDQLELRVGGASRMVVKNTGNVGIGTTAPTSLLDVQARPTGPNPTPVSEASIEAETIPQIRISTPGDNGATVDNGSALAFDSHNGRSVAAIAGFTGSTNKDTSMLAFYTHSSDSGPRERMRLDHNGWLGIGTRYPQSKLQIVAGYIQLDNTETAPAAGDCGEGGHFGRLVSQPGNGSTTAAELWLCGAAGWSAVSSGGGTAPAASMASLNVQGSGPDATLVATNDGRVFVGAEPTPDSLFAVTGNGTRPYVASFSSGPETLRIDDGQRMSTTGQRFGISVGATQNVFTIDDPGGNQHSLAIRGGYVGVGTDQPTTNMEVVAPNGQGLRISGDGPQLFWEEIDQGPAQFGMWAYDGSLHGRVVDHTNGMESDWLVVDRTDTTVDRVSFPNGRVGIGTGSEPLSHLLSVRGDAIKEGSTSWDTYSDARLKNVTGAFTRGLKDLLALAPVRFQYKKDNALGLGSDKEYIGFIAQEVAKVMPEAVTENEEGFQMLNPDAILWTMLNSIKEQQVQLTSQAQLIDKQQAQIAALQVATESLLERSKAAVKNAPSSTSAGSLPLYAGLFCLLGLSLLPLVRRRR